MPNHQKNTPLIFKLMSICFKQLVQPPPKISAWKILTFFEAQKVMMEVIGVDSIFPDFSWGKTFRVSTQMAKLVSTVYCKMSPVFTIFSTPIFSFGWQQTKGEIMVSPNQKNILSFPKVPELLQSTAFTTLVQKAVAFGGRAKNPGDVFFFGRLEIN